MPYQSYTWSEIKERLKARYEAKPFWTEEEALNAFNESLYLWNLCTGRWRERETLITGVGTYLYTLSANMVYHMRIEFNGYALSPSNREDLNNARYTWRTETTTTGGGVPTQPAVWAPVSLTSFYIWPADALGSNVLTADGVAATPVMSTYGGYLDLGEEHLDILLGYALHALTFSKGGAYFQATVPLFQAFMSAAAEENDQIKTSTIYRRVMGLDDRGFKRYRGASSLLDPLVQGVQQ